MKKMLLAPAVALAAAAATVSLTTMPAAAAGTNPDPEQPPSTETTPPNTDDPTSDAPETPDFKGIVTTPSAGSEITVDQLKAGIVFTADDVLGGANVSIDLYGADEKIGSASKDAEANGNVEITVAPTEDYTDAVDNLKDGDTVILRVSYARPPAAGDAVDAKEIEFTIKSDEEAEPPADTPKDDESPESPSTTPAEEKPSTDDTKPAAAVQAKLAVSPKTITAEKFVDEKNGGVKLTVTGAKPGETVEIKVTSSAKAVNDFTTSMVANSEGVATTSIYGTNETQASNYIGNYEVTVEANGKTLEGAFKVTANSAGNNNDNSGSEDSPNAGGSDDSWGDDGTAGELPRTGMELGALGAGVALLVVGGATVLVTRRTMKK